MSYQRLHTGPSYREYIIQLVKRRAARLYLEIGVRDGLTLCLVDCPSIGVDPSFALDCNVVGQKKRLSLYQMTSDEFFRDHGARAVAEFPLDVAFLDGLHQFEYLLRDFINTEALCHRNSLIMLDDCLPNNVEMTERVFKPEARENKDIAHWWTGDVWKTVLILKRFRPDLHIVAADTQPTGNIAITNLDPGSRVLSEKYFEIVSEYMRMPLDDVGLERFYRDLEVVSAAEIIAGFDASLFVGA